MLHLSRMKVELEIGGVTLGRIVCSGKMGIIRWLQMLNACARLRVIFSGDTESRGNDT